MDVYSILKKKLCCHSTKHCLCHEIFRAINLHGHDVFVRTPTGAGTSLYRFLPPLAMSGLSIGVVISPLNCPMDEQVSLLLVSSLG